MILDDFGYPTHALKRFDNDTRVATIFDITFGRARLAIAKSGDQAYDDIW